MALVTVLGTSRDRFFPPGVGGLILNNQPPAGVFRIDHDQVFQQSTYVQYQWGNQGPWLGFNWRYDSGMVAGAVPFATDANTPVDLTSLTPDQQVQAGLAGGRPWEGRRSTFRLGGLRGLCGSKFFSASLW